MYLSFCHHQAKLFLRQSCYLINGEWWKTSWVWLWNQSFTWRNQYLVGKGLFILLSSEHLYNHSSTWVWSSLLVTPRYLNSYLDWPISQLGSKLWSRFTLLFRERDLSLTNPPTRMSLLFGNSSFSLKGSQKIEDAPKNHRIKQPCKFKCKYIE